VPELLEIDANLASKISQGLAGDQLRGIANASGLQSLLLSGLQCAARGDTTASEVFQSIDWQ
jgi:type II secretory ATPase GspE/PulE/Tfp pilus assembly ATPase PilB-like protein